VRGPSCISVECVNRKHSGRVIIRACEGVSAKRLDTRGLPRRGLVPRLGCLHVGPRWADLFFFFVRN
jgi:hypothetical protein